MKDWKPSYTYMLNNSVIPADTVGNQATLSPLIDQVHWGFLLFQDLLAPCFHHSAGVEVFACFTWAAWFATKKIFARQGIILSYSLGLSVLPQASFFVVYNMVTTEVIAVFENTSDELLELFENFCDLFRNATLHSEVQFPCSASSNNFARQIQRR